MAQQINLYDPALERRRDWLALHTVAGTAAVLAVAIAALGFWARSDLPALTAASATGESRLQAMREQLAALGQQVARHQPDARLEQEVAAKRALLAMRSEVLDILRQSLGPEARSFADYLRGLARQSVSGLWLTGISVDAQSGGMEISGRTVDPALLPEYIRRLNREKVFQGQTFAALQLEAAKPETPAAGPAPATPPVVAHAPYHEFRLIPTRNSDAVSATGSAQLTRRSTAAGGAG